MGVVQIKTCHMVVTLRVTAVIDIDNLLIASRKITPCHGNVVWQQKALMSRIEIDRTSREPS